jgi:hypothetical protein
MNAPLDFRSLSLTRRAALMDDARRRAIEARREAMRAFWSALGRALRRGRHVFSASPDRAHGAC